MIPSGVRLYTWVDVDELLVRLQREDGWPVWLRYARAYWDNLTLAVLPGNKEQVTSWLSDIFEPRLDLGSMSISLESVGDRPRLLPVAIEEVVEEFSSPQFRPLLTNPTVLTPNLSEWQHPSPLGSGVPPVIAFHSFKGGVGRTVHALAFAMELLRGNPEASILLVDADLEAPGLTWFFQNRFPNPPISFVDLIALVHGDPDPQYALSLEIVADRLRGTQAEGIIALPAFRSSRQFTSFEVRPEHLVRSSSDPFILTSMLARLGHTLKADAVIVDLRAGFSEISAGLLLDPRVYRVLVTTVSSQSIKGTGQVLNFIGDTSPSRREDEPLPAIVFSQIPDGAVGEELAVRAESAILEAGQEFLEASSDADSSSTEQIKPTLDFVRVFTPFEPSLLALPDDWREVVGLLKGSRIGKRLSPLVDWIPLISPPLSQSQEEGSLAALKLKRDSLSRFSSRLIYAETGDIGEFLATSPLKNLSSDFRAKVPIAVIIGAKGAGKTYTFLQALRRGTWQEFVKDSGVANPSVSAFLYPVLASLNVKDTAREKVDRTSQTTATEIGTGQPLGPQDLRDYLRSELRKDLHEGEWRDRWLNAVAWSAGFKPEDFSAGREFSDHLRSRGQSVVALVDGLEDIFQEFSSRSSEQIALRSLLQDVPEWFSQQPGLPIGLLVFVRRDIVVSAVKQNSAQLVAKYEPYSLRWSPDEALRLIAWICLKAEAMPITDSEEVAQADKRRLTEMLVPLWGRKLGGENSREAHAADWVIAALSDLRGQIQARDVVRFLHEAAQDSKGDSFWKDRILVPTAIRKAVGQCSEKKIEDIGLENPRMKTIFSALQGLEEESRQLPFTAEQVRLTLEDLKVLEDNGVVLREGQEYHMAEIFRLGLDFRLRKGARPRVMTMARRARK